MGSAWLIVTGAGGPTETAARMAAGRRWLPFVAESSEAFHAERADAGLSVWSVCDEAARGSWLHVDEGGALVLDGWLREDDDLPVAASVAANTATMIDRPGADLLDGSLPGEYSIARLGHDGNLQAATGYLAGNHVYFGRRGAVQAISNRAMLVTAALDEGVIAGGSLPTPDAFELAWLVSGVGCPFGTATCWPGVHWLASDQLLSGGPSGIETRPRRPAERAAPTVGVAASPDGDDGAATRWSGLLDVVADSLKQLQRLPDVRFRVALTGGKDSRVVLAAALRAGLTDRIDYCYLRSVADHPDAVVAARLADHYGLELRRLEPPLAEVEFFDALERHLAQAEVTLAAFDLKGSDTRERIAGVHGNYGEIYKSHAMLRFLLGWPMARRFYASRTFIDRWDLLTDAAVARCRERLAAWLAGCAASGTRLDALHDRWHYETRMGRWLGQAQQADGVGPPTVQPLALPALHRAYQRLSLGDRRRHRLHFELLRGFDDWLWRQGFAGDRWAPSLCRGLGTVAPPVAGPALQLLPQFGVWQRQADEIEAFVLAPGDDGFFDVVRREAITQRFAQMRSRPSLRPLVHIMTCAGMRLALSRPLRPRPARVMKP